MLEPFLGLSFLVCTVTFEALSTWALQHARCRARDRGLGPRGVGC